MVGGEACVGHGVQLSLGSPSLLLGPPQKSVPAEEAHFINTKQLKFLLARSRWQVSSAASRRGWGGPRRRCCRGRRRGGKAVKWLLEAHEETRPEGWWCIPTPPAKMRSPAGHPSFSEAPCRVRAEVCATRNGQGRDGTTQP